MAGPSIETLTTHRSLDSPTLVPEENAVAHWWTDADGHTDLRLYHHDDGTFRTVEFDRERYDPDGWEQIRWTGDEFVLQSDPEIYRLPRDGELTSVGLHEDYTLCNGVDNTGRRLLYTLYDDRFSGESLWTLRVDDRESDVEYVLTEHPEQGYHAGFSPDDEWLAYRDNPDESAGRNRQVVATPDGETERVFTVGDPESHERQRRWHPDGERIVVEDRSTGWTRVGLHDWRAGETTWFGETDYNETFLALSPDGETLVTARSRDGLVTPYRYPVDDPEADRELDVPEGVVDVGLGLDLPAAGNEVLLSHETATHPGRWLVYDLDTDEARTVADTSTEALASASLVEPEYVSYESTDGLRVDAVLYRVGTAADPAPAVVYVHGGPLQAERRDFDGFAQFLASRGYAVLKPNYRGSTDRDVTFKRELEGVYGRRDVDDVAAGADWLADREWIDEESLAVVGHSYGAFNAAMQAIEYPDRWEAVVVENGTLDRVGPNNQFTRRHLVADSQEESREEFQREVSPVHRVDEVDTFVCVVQGSEDGGLDAAEEFVAALEDRGWTEGEQFRFEVLEGEGHVIRDVDPHWRLLDDVFSARLS